MQDADAISPIRRARLSQQIAVEICRLIRRGSFKAGDRLPSERELASQLDVSRTSLREALRTLESSGIVETRHGGGTYIQDFSAEGAISPLALVLEATGDIVGDLWEVRIIVEPAICSFATVRATEAEINKLERMIEEQEKLIPFPERNDDLTNIDRQFHAQLAQASHNQVSVQVVQMINHLLQEGRRYFVTTKERRLQALHGHKNIIQAIRKRDPGQARQAMLEHLQGVEEYILGQLMHDESTASER